MPGWLSQLSVWLWVKSWSYGFWVLAPHWALCWELVAWSLVWILCLSLCLSFSLSKINKHKKKINLLGQIVFLSSCGHLNCTGIYITISWPLAGAIRILYNMRDKMKHINLFGHWLPVEFAFVCIVKTLATASYHLETAKTDIFVSSRFSLMFL